MSKVLKELLNVYWLRPETALWRAIDIETMKDFKIQGKSLDLGCGDGILSFIRAGGKFDLSFDDYQSIGNLDMFYENFDVHDVFINSYQPIITRKPFYKFSFALDHKENLLNKAKCLEFYDNFIIHDANKVLPFEDNTFETIFSNIIYWLEEPQKSINEISRILCKGGRVALMLPNITMPESSFYNQLYVKNNDKNFEFLKYMDRGRYSSNIRTAKSFNEWKQIFENSGLKIIEHKTHLSKTVMQIWDIGLRPLFPVLLKLVQSIENKEKLIEIKQEWIEIFMKFLEPIFELEMQNKLNQKEEKAFHYFVLEK